MVELEEALELTARIMDSYIAAAAADGAIPAGDPALSRALPRPQELAS